MSFGQLNAARETAIRRLSVELDLEFIGSDEFKDIALLNTFRVYKNSTGNRKIVNMVQRQDGLLESRMTVFDMTWVVSTGKSAVRYHQTMFFIQSKKLALPDFYLRPEDFLDRIGAWLGLQDIDFVEYPEFSNSNILRGEDEELVRDLVVTPQFSRLFQLNKEWHVEGMGYFLVLYKKHKLLHPDAIKDLIMRGMELYSILENKE